MNRQQWPSHQQSMYKKISSRNAKAEASMTPEQREHLQKLWMTEIDIYGELLKTTDYPDGLAEVVARSRIIKLVNNETA